MRKLTLPILSCTLITLLSACHSESDMAAMQQFRDSLFARYPGKVGAIHIKPDNREYLVVALGAPAIYELSPAERQTEAIAVGAMALRIFGDQSYLKSGKLVLTRDVHNEKDNPADGLISDMKLDSLIKARK